MRARGSRRGPRTGARASLVTEDGPGIERDFHLESSGTSRLRAGALAGGTIDPTCAKAHRFAAFRVSEGVARPGGVTYQLLAIMSRAWPAGACGLDCRAERLCAPRLLPLLIRRGPRSVGSSERLEAPRAGPLAPGRVVRVRDEALIGTWNPETARRPRTRRCRDALRVRLRVSESSVEERDLDHRIALFGCGQGGRRGSFPSARCALGGARYLRHPGRRSTGDDLPDTSSSMPEAFR